MTETKLDRALKKSSQLLTNKRSRSIIFLLISLFFILAINSLLPLISGGTQYTSGVVTSSYTDFLANPHYVLTFLSKASVNAAIKEGVDISSLQVSYYTRYFFEDTAWYISTVVSMVSAVILFYSLFNYLMTRAKDTYTKYVDLDKQLATITETLLNPETFEPWIDNVFNKRRKIQQHIANVKYKLDVLERKTSYEVKNIFRNYFSVGYSKESLDLASFKGKERRYMKKKTRLLALLDEQYIEEFVVSGKVKNFQHVYPMFVYNGANATGHTVDSYSLLKSDSERISKDSMVKIIVTLTIATVFATLLTLTLQGAEGLTWWEMLIQVLFRVTPLLIQIPLAIDYSDSFMDQQVITTLISRRTISYLYLSEMRKQGVEERTVKEIKDIVNEEVVVDGQENQHVD